MTAIVVTSAGRSSDMTAAVPVHDGRAECSSEPVVRG